MRLTPNFELSEFRCRDGTEVPERYHGNVIVLAVQLEVLRADLEAPIKIVSGYRTPAHNAHVDGAEKSRHLTAEAADVRVAGRSASVVHAAILRLIGKGYMRDGGVGLYRTWVHYDIGPPRRWGLGAGRRDNS